MNIYRNVATGTYADGGGLFIHDSTVRITDCQIDKNEAEILKLHDRDRYGKIKRETSDQRSRGAGIYLWKCDPQGWSDAHPYYTWGLVGCNDDASPHVHMTRTTISENVIGRGPENLNFGGGIWVGGGTVHMDACDVGYNRVSSWLEGGGGIFIDDGIVNIDSSSIHHNQVSGELANGAGIKMGYHLWSHRRYPGVNPDLTLSNSLVYSNGNTGTSLGHGYIGMTVSSP